MSIRALLLSFLAVGCATPTSGTYLIEETISTTDCEGESDEVDGDADPVDIVVAEDKTTVTVGQETCPLTDLTFLCEDVETLDLADGAVTQTITTSVTGTWTSSTTIDGANTTATSCDDGGSGDCETMNIPSCSSTVEWTGTLQQ